MEPMKTIEVYDPLPAGMPAEPPPQVENIEPETETDNQRAITACCERCHTPIDSEDERLVQGCLRGDQQAWEELIDKYKRLIYSVPLRYGASADDAGDVFQAVCIEVFNSLSQLKNVGSLRSWLITVAIRQSYRWKKKQSYHVELDAMEPEVAEEIAAVPEVMAQVEQEQIVREVVNKLSPRNAELVRLLFFEHPPLPYVEVARRLGLATGSIGFIRGRCLERLRKLLLESGFRGYKPEFRAHARHGTYAGVRQ
jgi:RNA polymerase sigma factor (sigma-70 family)